MPTFRNVDLEEPSTVTAEVAAVSLTRNSSAELQEILTLGDPDVSTNLARIMPSAPDSTMSGLVVRQVGYSTTVQVSSVAGAVIVRSSAADFQATVQQASTGWQVQISGQVRVGNSTIGDLLASVQQNSTVWQVQQSTGVHGARASTVARASITQSSTSVTLQSSNASRVKWSVFNNPNNGAALYVALGGGAASTADFDVMVRAGAYYELPDPGFTGAITGIWESTGTGFARVCEWRP